VFGVTTNEGAATNRFATSLEALEAGVHVPVEEQTTEAAEAPPGAPVEPSELNRLRLMSILGDGRW